MRTIAIGLACACAALGQVTEIRADRLRADLTFLASPALEGRLSLARGSEVAIQWIAAEFAKAGLKPANGDSYLQELTLIEYRTDTANSSLSVEQPSGTKRFPFSRGVRGGFPGDVDLRAPLVFAGYGITAPEFGYDDYRGIDARGKIVLVFDHEPQEADPKSVFNGVGNTRHANTRFKAWNAQRHGALALLVANEPNRKHPSNQERLARIPAQTTRVRRVPTQALDDSDVRIPSLSLDDDVAAALMATAGRKLGELQAAIDATLAPASLSMPDTTVEVKIVNAERRRGTTANVAGLLEGGDPLLKRETIVYSGHYDHDGIEGDGIRPGADDNASGTVGVVELARAFAKSPTRPKRSMLFVVFAAEERGLLGSYYYATHPLRPLETTRAVINFDMIGRNETPSRQTDGLVQIAPDTSNELNLIGTINSPDYREVVEQQNRQIGLRLNYKWDDDAALNIFQRSDQFPFALRDIPAVWWFTGFHPDYHQTTDTVEKINFVKMEKILKLAYQTGTSFANANSGPRFSTQAAPAK